MISLFSHKCLKQSSLKRFFYLAKSRHTRPCLVKDCGEKRANSQEIRDRLMQMIKVKLCVILDIYRLHLFIVKCAILSRNEFHNQNGYGDTIKVPTTIKRPLWWRSHFLSLNAEYNEMFWYLLRADTSVIFTVTTSLFVIMWWRKAPIWLPKLIFCRNLFRLGLSRIFSFAKFFYKGLHRVFPS